MRVAVILCSSALITLDVELVGCRTIMLYLLSYMPAGMRLENLIA